VDRAHSLAAIRCCIDLYQIQIKGAPLTRRALRPVSALRAARGRPRPGRRGHDSRHTKPLTEINNRTGGSHEGPGQERYHPPPPWALCSSRQAKQPNEQPGARTTAQSPSRRMVVRSPHF